MSEPRPLTAEEVAAYRRLLDALDAFPGERERRAGQKWLVTEEFERVVLTLETAVPERDAAREKARELGVSLLKRGKTIVALEEAVAARNYKITHLEAENARLALLAEERRKWMEDAERFASEQKAEVVRLARDLAAEREASQSRAEWLDAANRSLSEDGAEVERLKAEVAHHQRQWEYWGGALEDVGESLRQSDLELAAVTAERDALKERIAAFVGEVAPTPEPAPKPKRTRKKKGEDGGTADG
jgi:chromosome segregation ATPase